jgi:hypothetical protein
LSSGVNFIHKGTIPIVARSYRAERVALEPFDVCYPDFEVLAYTYLTEKLRSSSPRTAEEIEALCELWEAMEVDPQFDTNMSSVNRVSNKLLYLNSF